MKVLKVGNVPKIVYRNTCWCCHAEIEYDREDIKSDRPVDYVICPCCRNWVDHAKAIKEEIKIV